MAFKTWHTGVHIQQDKVLAVALVREKSGWGLRRWWQLPLAAGIIRDGQILQPEQLAAALREWRQLLPHQHQIFLAFPAARTLQRTLPRPSMTLRDSEQTAWIAAAMSRELEMAPDTLRFDYAEDTFSNAYHVTAAQNKEVATLLELARELRLRLATITPDAGALAHLLPFVASPGPVRRLARSGPVAMGNAPPVGQARAGGGPGRRKARRPAGTRGGRDRLLWGRQF